MPYSSCLSLEKLILPTRLGCGEEERAMPQEVSLDVRLYANASPAGMENDDADFLCYGDLGALLVKVAAAREYKLLEFLCGELYRAARGYVDAAWPGAAKPALWLRVTKIPPVPYAIGGASFTFTDAPDLT